MKRRPAWSLVLLLALSCLAGPEACNGSAQCLRHTDCTRTESCELGTCVMKPTSGSGLGDAGAGDEPSATGGRPVTSGGRSASGGSVASAGEASSGGGAGGAGGAAGADG